MSTGTRELLYLSTGCSVQKDPQRFRDTEWESWSSPYGWPVLGVWPKYAQPSAVKAVARSHSQQLLATGGSGGQVNLFRYPCCVSGAEAHHLGGHASHISAVAFSADDRFLVSSGGRDQALLVWAVTER